jgi:ABC-type tungstate transport system permease subunit
VKLAVMVEGDRPLLNLYSVMEVNPANGPRVNAAGGKAFADFMLAPETQAIIKTFGVDRYGQPLFIPVSEDGGPDMAPDHGVGGTPRSPKPPGPTLEAPPRSRAAPR